MPTACSARRIWWIAASTRAAWSGEAIVPACECDIAAVNQRFASAFRQVNWIAEIARCTLFMTALMYSPAYRGGDVQGRTFTGRGWVSRNSLPFHSLGHVAIRATECFRALAIAAVLPDGCRPLPPSRAKKRGRIPRAVKDALRRPARPLPDLPRSQSLACADRVPLPASRP